MQVWLIWPSRKKTGPIAIVEAYTESEAMMMFFRRNQMYFFMGSVELELLG